jgi:hypothetical protein
MKCLQPLVTYLFVWLVALTLISDIGFVDGKSWKKPLSKFQKAEGNRNFASDLRSGGDSPPFNEGRRKDQFHPGSSRPLDDKEVDHEDAYDDDSLVSVYTRSFPSRLLVGLSTGERNYCLFAVVLHIYVRYRVDLLHIGSLSTTGKCCICVIRLFVTSSL